MVGFSQTAVCGSSLVDIGGVQLVGCAVRKKWVALGFGFGDDKYALVEELYNKLPAGDSCVDGVGKPEELGLLLRAELVPPLP